jgi:hypothetical protein
MRPHDHLTQFQRTQLPLQKASSRRKCASLEAAFGAVRKSSGYAVVLAGLIGTPSTVLADEGGVSMWLPGIFGSLAAAPLQPGFSLTTFDYHTSVSAGGDVALAREFTIGQIPANVTGKANANLNSNADLGFVIPSYVFGTPILGGQGAVGVMALVGGVNTSLAGTVSGTIGTPYGSIPFMRSASISDSVFGVGDLYPQASLRWNMGVNNVMTYITGDIPVGTYASNSLANVGIGHGAVDAGGGYTYFNPKTGQEFSGVLGFTYNFINSTTQYQNGVDMHFDWGASQFLTKQFQVGAVGYVYKEIGCDSGSGDHLGCFQSQVVGAGPQAGYIFPLGEMQGYVNVKVYKEFAAEHRPEGWNVWATFVVSLGNPISTAPKRSM